MLNEIKIILYRSKGYLILLVVLAVLLLGTTHAVQNIITGNMRRMGDTVWPTAILLRKSARSSATAC